MIKRLLITMSLIGLTQLVGTAQTDDSGVRPVHGSKPKATRPKRTTGVAQKPRARPKTGDAKAATASLSISVSEPEARIYLTDAKGASVLNGEYAMSPNDGSPFVADGLGAGQYTLVVKKDDFLDEEQHLSIARGKAASTSVVLKPSVGFITVDANVADPEIEISGLGRFHAVRRTPVRPGTYSVTVRKKGYVAETQDVIVTTAGVEKNLLFRLEPISIDDMISSAQSAAAKEQYDDALKICADVIDIRSDEPRAYKIRGDILFKRGASGADAAWLNALRYGGIVTLPVKLRGGPAVLVAGDLSFDRDYMQFRSPARPELNFSLMKIGVAAVEPGYDPQKVPFVSFQSNGGVAGKRPNRPTALYPQGAFLRSSQKEAFCSDVGGGIAKCAADIENLSKLISGWLAGL